MMSGKAPGKDETESRSGGNATVASAAANAPSGVSIGSLILDRKKMEEERLARLKRRAPNDDAPSEPPKQRMKLETASSATPAQTSSSATEDGRPPGSSSESAPVASPQQQAPGLQSPPFLHGSVRRTWAAGYPRQGDDIKLEEILQKNELELAVISSFQWDDAWLLSKIDISRTRLMLVAFAADDHMKSEMRSNAPPNTRFCFPPMLERGSMHSKLQLLKFKSYIRIVIPTGNLTPYDWGETGVMENMVFVIDLPRLQDLAEFVPTDFSMELCWFLEAMGLDGSLVQSLANYDFSRTKDMAFVHTIAGRHDGDDWKRTGYCGLGRAIHSLGLATQDAVDVDAVCASIGSLNENYLAAMYYACQGDPGLKELASRARGGTKKATTSGNSSLPSLLRERFRLYFPSEQTVTQSRGGQRSAGTICFQKGWWSSPKFPQYVLRDFSSTRPGLLLHTKCILARRGNSSEPLPGWAYVGSANMSESAWGKLVKDRQTGKERLDCRNWECGVVLPATLLAARGEKGSEFGIFDGVLPMPIQFPGRSYSATGPGSHPWFFHD